MYLIQATMDATANTLAAVVAVTGPDLGSGGTAPPGSGNITTILKWGVWIAIACCLAGILIAAGKIALAHRRGEGAEAAQGVVWPMAALTLIGASGGIVQALL